MKIEKFSFKHFYSHSSETAASLHTLNCTLSVAVKKQDSNDGWSTVPFKVSLHEWLHIHELCLYVMLTIVLEKHYKMTKAQRKCGYSEGASCLCYCRMTLLLDSVISWIPCCKNVLNCEVQLRLYPRRLHLATVSLCLTCVCNDKATASLPFFIQPISAMLPSAKFGKKKKLLCKPPTTKFNICTHDANNSNAFSKLSKRNCLFMD